MITEYVVLGGLLVVAGAVQIWLRFGPWAKEQREAEAAAAKKRAENRGGITGEEEGSGSPAAEGEPAEPSVVMMARGSRVWNKWTGILGPLSMAFGVMLVVWGLVDSQ